MGTLTSGAFSDSTSYANFYQGSGVLALIGGLILLVRTKAHLLGLLLLILGVVFIVNGSMAGSGTAFL